MLGRRTFLKGLGAAAAFGAVGLGRGVAQARLPLSPVAVLVVDFVGGWNVHASFAARTNPSVNPHGMYEGDTGVMRLSNVLFRDRDAIVDRSSASWGTTIPGFEDAARAFSIIGATKHSRRFTVDDHVQTARFAGTGYLDRLDMPGLGTVIGRYAPQDVAAPPAVVVNPGNASGMMASAPGAWLPHAPLAIASTALPSTGGRASAGGRLEAAIDAAARNGRPALARARLDGMLSYKEALRRYGAFFLDPAIHTAGAPDARYEAGILGKASPTNAQLLEALGGSGDAGEAAVALALRCIEGGSRFVAVGYGWHDFHENEDAQSSVYARDAQILAGLSFVLRQTGLADKVLLVGVSEMARSPYEGTSYNEAGGTDHGVTGLVTPKGEHGSSRQTVLLAHGPVKPGREAYPADPEYGDAVGQPCMTAELLAFLAECAGVEREDHPWSESPDGGAISADALAQALAS